MSLGLTSPEFKDILPVILDYLARDSNARTLNRLRSTCTTFWYLLPIPLKFCGAHQLACTTGWIGEEIRLGNLSVRTDLAPDLYPTPALWVPPQYTPPAWKFREKRLKSPLGLLSP